jgi:hypothetical protein
MHGNIAPHIAGQAAASSLDELAAQVCKAQAGFVAATSNAVTHAIDAGQALIAAKELTPHGQWGKFLNRCYIGERQAERYMRLAQLAAANPTCRSDLAGLTIEKAIEKLSPPKPHTTKTAAAAPKVNVRATHVDLIAVWIANTPAQRTKAIDGIGLEALLGAIPDPWWSLIEERVADRHRVRVSTMRVASYPLAANDMSIPEFLRREPHSPVEVGGAR